MALNAGQRLGSYEILAPLGAGGMGEVYKARDTRLNRFVAIKVLPERVSQDAELKRRFEREAQTLASLSHPHICPVFDVGQQDRSEYLVMEFLDAQTLAARLAKGGLPLDQALKIACEISDALDKAHRQGIVHRDVKPGNVMLTKVGAKLLDFGLAKLKQLDEPTGLSGVPTRADVTAQGTILGTLQYMSPEQLEGRDADARSDIFAFGTVLYEMITGKKAFEGKSQASLIGAIMTAEPQPLIQLQPLTPAPLEQITRLCLAKNPEQRWQSAADLHTQLKWIAGNPASAATPHASAKRFSIREIVAWSMTAIVFVAALLLWRSNRFLFRPDSVERAATHLPLSTPTGVVPARNRLNPAVAISPDGKQLVYAGSSSQGARLYLQRLDRNESAKPITGTEDGFDPFFSSDGKWLAFVAHSKLQKIALSGGAPVELANSEIGGGVFSLDDETIYFGSFDQGIWRIPSKGGKPEQVTKSDHDGFDNAHLWPAILPGNRLLYTSAYGRNRIMAVDLQTGTRTMILENGFFARYASSGHLIFAQGHSLMAAPFDPDTLKTGTPVKILDNVVTGHEQNAEYAISQDGALVYLEGTSDFDRTLVRIDRNGTKHQIVEGARPYSTEIKFAHDGRRLALTLWEGQQDVYIYDLQRDGFDRVSTDPHNDWTPLWSPKDDNLVFSSVRTGQIELYVTRADKSRPTELLYASGYPKWAYSWSKDGKLISFNEVHPDTNSDIWIYSFGDNKARPFRNASFNERYGAFSPDGRWLAYDSDELKHPEIYVVPYPGPGPSCKVSTGGGEEPRWSADGSELFYRRGSTAMVVNVANEQFCDANPQPLFDGLETYSWDVSPKADFFVTLERRDPPHLHLVLNWFDELKALIATTK